ATHRLVAVESAKQDGTHRNTERAMRALELTPRAGGAERGRPARSGALAGRLCFWASTAVGLRGDRTRRRRQRKLLTFGASILVCGLPSFAAAQSGVGLDVTKLLQKIKAADSEQLAVSEEDGRFLRLLIVSSGTKRALEIGGAYGYSA